MNLQEFVDDINENNPLLSEEVKSPEEEAKETEKFIKNINKVRFNLMFKNIQRISQFMNDLGSSVRGVVKSTILSGTMELFKQSRERSQQFRKSKEETIKNYVEKFYDKLNTENSLAQFIEDVEFERIAFEKIMENVSASMLAGVSNNDQLTFFTTQFLKKEMLQSAEERKYHERSLELIEYFVIETMKLRVVFSCIQTIIARLVSKVKLSKVEDADRKANEMGKVLIKFYKQFVENKYGTAIGSYLSTYVEDYYHSTDDKKEQFTKFENIINVVLGIKKA